MCDTEIRVKTGDLRAAASKFKFEAENMDTAVKTAEKAIEPCRDHISKKVKESLDDWDGIKEAFKKSLENLIEASDKLEKTAEKFENADS